VLLPDNLNVPILINPGADNPTKITREPAPHSEEQPLGR
jgi:hypothetical protein